MLDLRHSVVKRRHRLPKWHYVLFHFLLCDNTDRWRRTMFKNIIPFSIRIIAVHSAHVGAQKEIVSNRRKMVFSLNVNHAVHSDQSYTSSWIIIQFAPFHFFLQRQRRTTKKWSRADYVYCTRSNSVGLCVCCASVTHVPSLHQSAAIQISCDRCIRRQNSNAGKFT